ncbi:DUF1450 domain-containing protein [Halomontanus rarus]|uniref:DUF1450 domain-containing protein n=1 Tax=Halomontanus rarus TaxID=3034020 RepID=UPI001A99B261
MIEYCLSNVDDDARQRLTSVSDATEASCLEHCGICYLEPFLVIDGDFHRVESHEGALADCNHEESLEKRERDGSITGGEQ